MTDLAQAGLGHIPVSQALATTLARASEGARATGAADVSLEHVLAALCDDEDAIDVLAASNIDAGRLKSEVITHLASLDGGAHRARAVTVGASAALLRILEAAAAAARGGRRRDINGAIVLAAIVGDGRSAAAQILQSHGLTFDGAIRALQSALGQPSRQNAPSLAPAEDVLARARERVQSRSAPSLREIMLDKPHLASRPAPQPAGGVTDFVPAHGPVVAAPPAAKLDVPQNDAPGPAQSPPPASAPPVAPPAKKSESHDAVVNTAEPGPLPEPARAGTEAAAPPPAAERDASADPASAQQPNVAAETGRAPAAAPPPFAPPPADGYAARSEPGYAAPAPSADQKKPGGFIPPLPPANTQPRPGPALPHAPHPIPPPPGAAATGGPQHPFPPQHPPPAQPMLPPPSMAPGSAPLPPVLERASIGPRPPPIPPQVPPPGASPPPPRSAGGRLAPGSAPPAAPYPSPAPSPMPAPAARAPTMAPGAPVPPPASGPPAGRASVQKAELGQLVENVPRVMRAGVSERVEVRLAHTHIKGLTEGLEGGGLAWRHDVTITKAMSVRLRAPEGGFFIETASPETQWIDSQFADVGDDYASWRFMITPQRSGRARLQIIVSARTVGADGLAAETAFPDQIIDLKVRANYVNLGKHLAGWTLAAVAGGALATFGEGAMSAAAEVFRRLTSG